MAGRHLRMVSTSVAAVKKKKNKLKNVKNFILKKAGFLPGNKISHNKKLVKAALGVATKFGVVEGSCFDLF